MTHYEVQNKKLLPVRDVAIIKGNERNRQLWRLEITEELNGKTM